MTKFFLLLWIKWAIRVTVGSILMAVVISVVITIYIYITQGLPSFNKEIADALIKIIKFWFPIAWSLTLLISLFRSLKYIFNSCIDGYQLKVLQCSTKNVIEVIGYGDLIKVWRKWLMLMIWLVGAQMILSIVFTNLLTDFGGIFEWFDIYFLFLEVLIAGYFSFMILVVRCKQIKVVRC